MDGIKIVTIGGGSSYTPELAEGFIKRYGGLPVRELWLVDIPEGERKLNTVGELVRRMVRKAGLPIAVHMTLDRRKALEGADFVTTQIRVGGLSARIKDERIPLAHRVIGQETNGPGGLFKAFRTIPVIVDIAKDMAALCPDAWLINFTNPSGMVTEALFRYGGMQKAIGLCNVPIHMERNIAALLKAEPGRVRMDFAGINHMVFGLKVYLDGKNVTRQVIDLLNDAETALAMKNITGVQWEPEFAKALGVIPCPYYSYYCKRREMLEHQLEEAEESGVRGEVVRKVEAELFELYQDPELDVKPVQLEKRGGAYYSEAACRLIDSIHNDRCDIQPVDTRNNGAIKGIPADSAVEVSSVITGQGPRPIAVGELPVAVNGLVQQLKSFERVAVEAAVTGDYGKALLAMAINPLVPSDTVAKRMLDEMLEAHKAYLPQFFGSRL